MGKKAAATRAIKKAWEKEFDEPLYNRQYKLLAVAVLKMLKCQKRKK